MTLEHLPCLDHPKVNKYPICYCNFYLSKSIVSIANLKSKDKYRTKQNHVRSIKYLNGYFYKSDVTFVSVQKSPYFHFREYPSSFKVLPNGKGHCQSPESHVNLIQFKFSRGFFSDRPDRPLFLFLITRSFFGFLSKLIDILPSDCDQLGMTIDRAFFVDLKPAIRLLKMAFR